MKQTARTAPPQDAGARIWRAGLLALVALGLVAFHASRHVSGWPSAPRLSVLDAAKLLAAGRTLLLFVVVQIAAAGAAWPLRRLFASLPSALLRAVVRQSVGLVVLANAVFLLAAGRLLGLRPLLALLVGCAFLGLWPLASGLRGLKARVAAHTGVHGLALLALALIFGLPLLCAFVPLYGWDALTYHLALPERWLYTGQLFVARESIYTSLPLLIEMLYTLALGIDTPALAKLLNLGFGLLLVLALIAVARRVAPRAWLLAPLALVADPLFLWELTVVYSDVALALFALLAAEALLDWRASVSPTSVIEREGATPIPPEAPPPLGRSEPGSVALARAALFCGACAGTKYQGAFVALALGIGVLLDGALCVRRRLLACGALGLGALALLAPWLVRNLALTGDLFARNLYDPIFLRQMLAFNRSVGMGRGLGALLLAPWNVTLQAPGEEVSYVHAFGYPIGPLYLLGLIAALSVPVLHDRRGVRLLLRAALVLFLLWFLTIQESRYLLPVFAFLALAGAAAGEWLVQRAPRPALVVFGAAAVFAFAVAQVEFWNEHPRTFRMALGDIPASRVQDDAPAERAGEWLRATLPRGARVLSLFEARGWHLRGLDYVPFHQNEGSPVLLGLHEAFAAGTFCRWLSERHISHVLVNWEYFEGAPILPVEGYSRGNLDEDRRRLRAFLENSAQRDSDFATVSVYSLPASACREPS